MTSIKRSWISDALSSAGATFSGYVRRTKSGSNLLLPVLPEPFGARAFGIVIPARTSSRAICPSCRS